MRIRLTFAPVGPGPPTVQRVRRLLKAAVRSYGLQCLEVSQVQNHQQPEIGQENQMNIKQAFPSKFLKAADLDGDRVLTIRSVAIEDVGTDRTEEKPVVSFQEIERRLVLNRTNADTIADLYGADTDDWAGRQIILTPSETDFAGKRVPCIRIRTRAPGGAAAPAPGSSDGDIRAAKAEVWAAWRKANPGASEQELAESLKAAARKYLGLPIEHFTAAQLRQFAADGFVRKPAELPLGDERHFSEDDIPF
jgi:hypothetical protein